MELSIVYQKTSTQEVRKVGPCCNGCSEPCGVEMSEGLMSECRW